LELTALLADLRMLKFDAAGTLQMIFVRVFSRGGFDPKAT
jgi:hypothetical protein